MPKLFPIVLEVEELAVGRVMRQLHNTPGIAKVHLDMGTPKTKPNGDALGKPRGPYKPRKVFATTGQDEIIKLLAKHKTMATPEIRDAFSAMGRSPASTSSLLFEMKNADEIKTAADGSGWMLTKKVKDRLRHKK